MKGTGEGFRDLMEQRDEQESSAKVVQPETTESDDPSLQAKWEEALEDVEEKTDIAAAKTARAEAAAEFAEFDENIPINQEVKEGEERTAAEEEVDKIEEELSDIEKYALRFLEMIQDPTQVEQLKLAEVCVLTKSHGCKILISF